MLTNEPPPPWKGFLADFDSKLPGALDLHCLGGFVSTLLYGVPRATYDLDALPVLAPKIAVLVLELAGRGSPLSRKHKIYLDYVSLAEYPEDYDQRLTEMFPGCFANLRLFGMDPYDLALCKLGRNMERDRFDVLHLALTVPFDLNLLRERYEREVRPNLLNSRTHDWNFSGWIEMIEEERTRRS